MTKSVPGLVTISLIVLTVQTLAAIVTGSLWIFLLHFPLANLGLCLLFARTAGGRSPIAARLAAEVIGLRCPPATSGACTASSSASRCCGPACSSS